MFDTVNSSPCESPKRTNMLKSEWASLLEKNIELNKQVKELSMKQHKAYSFGTVKTFRTNPTPSLMNL